MNRQSEGSYEGDEVADLFEKASANIDSPSYRKTHVGDLLGRVFGDECNDGVPRHPGSSELDDPRASIKKPPGKYWTKVPSSDEEKAIYQGLHIHTVDNPLGLHSHVPGGTLGGGHSHGPSNQQGEHYHGEAPVVGKNVDGRHVHKRGENMPSGPHVHCPENFA
jgi:hypothetical protein